MEAFREHFGMSWPVLVEGGKHVGGKANSTAYGVRAIPHAAVLDHVGTVRYMRVGSSRSREMDELIGKLVEEAEARR